MSIALLVIILECWYVLIRAVLRSRVHGRDGRPHESRVEMLKASGICIVLVLVFVLALRVTYGTGWDPVLVLLVPPLTAIYVWVRRHLLPSRKWSADFWHWLGDTRRT